MGLNLLYGGHLTHGWKVNFSAKFYNSVQYITDDNGFIDYDYLEKLVKKEKPKVIFSGSTAYPRIYDYKKISEIAHLVNAYYIADIAHEAGFIAAGLIDSPCSYADIITTTTHKTLRGPRGAMIMCNGKISNPLKNVPLSRENLPTLIDRAIFPGLQGGPHNHITAGIAVALEEANSQEYKRYMETVGRNAKVLAQTLMENDFNLVTQGTDNHLLIIDLRNKNITGKEAEENLQRINITVNKNTVPNDPNPPFNPSGIRLGTPALTTRGFQEKEFIIIAKVISQVLNNPNNTQIINTSKDIVRQLTNSYPLYKELKYN